MSQQLTVRAAKTRDGDFLLFLSDTTSTLQNASIGDAACMSCKRIMEDGNHDSGVVFGLFRINPPANVMVMSFVASVTLEFLSKDGHVGSNLPRFSNGVPLNRRDVEGATVKTRKPKVMFFDKLDNALPTPVRATSWPLDSDAPPALDDSRSKGDERLPNASKQGTMFADSSGAPRQFNIDVLPGAAPRTWH